jgi:hypothetical protein
MHGCNATQLAAFTDCISNRARSLARGGLREVTQRHETISVGKTDKGTLISSSNGNVPSSVPSTAGYKKGDIFVRGKSGVHAEVKNVRAAEKLGTKITKIEASRPICAGCQRTLKKHNPDIEFGSPTR